jgi:hypothetical protein
MSAVDLLNPILEGGISSVNFFNGRLLTANDLSREQEANREAARRLGQAIGAGVAYGLEVSKSTSKDSTKDTPLLTIESGLAINRRGQTLRLENQTDISLIRQTNTDSTNPPQFAECLPLQFGASFSGDGVFVLTISPTTQNKGRATVSGLDGALARCNTDVVVSAVQFRLIQIPAAVLAEVSNQKKLRNHLAYRFFGAAKTASFAADPIGTSLDDYGLLGNLSTLTECDVPLAVLNWSTSGGIEFIDHWSVRRRITQGSLYQHWNGVVSERRRSEAEAAFLQFQEQLNAIIGDGSVSLSTLQADQYFEYLPAAGFLPNAGGGLDLATFLGPYAPTGTTSVDEGIMRARLQRALLTEPIRINSFDDAAAANVKPPAPVDLLVSPNHDSFVLFARSERSRIRVFLTPQPSDLDDLVIAASTDSTSEILFASPTRNNKRFEFQNVEPASYLIDVTLPGYQKPDLTPVEGIGGRTSDVTVQLTPVPRGSISVDVVETKSPPVNINDKVQSVSAKDPDGNVFVATHSAGEWVLSDLLPDKYDISVAASGFTANAVLDVVVTANQTTDVQVKAQAIQPSKQTPANCVNTKAIVSKSKVTLRVCMNLKDLTFQQPKMTLLAVAVDDTGERWLNLWQDYLDDIYRNQKITLATPKLLADPTSVLGGGRVVELGDQRFEKITKASRAQKVTTQGSAEMNQASSEVFGIEMNKEIIARNPDGYAVFNKVYVPVSIDPID